MTPFTYRSPSHACHPISPNMTNALDSRIETARRKVVTTMGVDPELFKAVREGTYVVDPSAVADAILRHHERRDEADRLSAVLEALERDGVAGGVADDEPGTLPDVA
jgi:hypothetical protein